MGFEARKTNRRRDETFVRTYLSGTVLDIGCGPDLVVPTATPFDVEDGDANNVLKYLRPESFDCVHSSHCLEHMHDVPEALAQWWALVKPGGHMVLVVPDEDLYEQGHWPSLFNADHRATFRFQSSESWSPISYNLHRLASNLPECEVIDIARQDNGFDYSLLKRDPRKLGKGRRLWQRALVWLQNRRRGLIFRLKIDAPWLERLCERVERRLGKPVDQTGGEALCQIQAVLHKLPAGR